VYRQYRSISDKPSRFRSLRVVKKGRVETLGITPRQEQLSLVAEGQLQRSLGQFPWSGGAPHTWQSRVTEQPSFGWLKANLNPWCRFRSARFAGNSLSPANLLSFANRGVDHTTQLEPPRRTRRTRRTRGSQSHEEKIRRILASRDRVCDRGSPAPWAGKKSWHQTLRSP
ncbi:MAG: hypothetical protein RLY70_4516, partial [Planctomycetota bacterium]